MNDPVILCVDDEPNNLGVLRQVLKEGYRLVFARSGPEALAAADKHRPSLILLDVEMPDVDGYEVCRRLKGDPHTRGIPVIFITSRTNEPDEMTGFDVGGVDYIAKPFSALIVLARVRTHLRLVRVEALEDSNRSAIHMLGQAGHYNDADTGEHIWRIAAYSRVLAEASGWSQGRAELIEMAAAMHDTGKIGIPDAVLKKPDRLDDHERAVMQTHTRIGYDILSKSQAPLFQLAAEIALYHHEKWDGSGYPFGLSGESIPEAARIVAVADVFDALGTKRPYKEAWPLDRLLETLRQIAGSHLDPHLVDRFLVLLPRILEIKRRLSS